MICNLAKNFNTSSDLTILKKYLFVLRFNKAINEMLLYQLKIYYLPEIAKLKLSSVIIVSPFISLKNVSTNFVENKNL